MSVQILAVSDAIDQRIHSSSLAERMPDVELALSCGDLPGRYLEFIVDAINTPLYYVLGNHAEEIQRDSDGHARGPLGCVDISGKVVRDPKTGLILAGLPGSPKYNNSEPEQYTEREMAWKIARMTPQLLWNKRRYGRALDVLVTHSPARDLGDQEDEAHRGFKAIRSFLDRWQPAYHLHGHIHLYDRSQSPVLHYDQTTIINVYPYQALEITVDAAERSRVSNMTVPASTGTPVTGNTSGIGVGLNPLKVDGGGRLAQLAAYDSTTDVTGDRRTMLVQDRLPQPTAHR